MRRMGRMGRMGQGDEVCDKVRDKVGMGPGSNVPSGLNTPDRAPVKERSDWQFRLGLGRGVGQVLGVIHPSAIVHPRARLHESVTVGPYAVIDEGVELGEGCIVGPHVYLTGNTTVGKGNRFFSGAVIGEAPQDLKYKGDPTGLRIGDRNRFRENTTVNRGCFTETQTVVGSDNLLMAGAHVGHDCRLGDHVIIANGALLGGHVNVADRAFISGNCLVHQFVRVGTLAMMQGGAAISKDLPPFTIARGDNGICGLNVVGMRRAGMSAPERLELRKLYHALFRSGMRLSAAVESARKEFKTPVAQAVIEFVATSKRGVCADTGGAAGAEEQQDE